METKRPNPFTCPQCGSTAFTLRRKITLWQRVFVANVDPRGDYEQDEEDLGDTDEEHPFDGATCTQCGTGIPLRTLLPWAHDGNGH